MEDKLEEGSHPVVGSLGEGSHPVVGSSLPVVGSLGEGTLPVVGSRLGEGTLPGVGSLEEDTHEREDRPPVPVGSLNDQLSHEQDLIAGLCQ